MKIYSKTMFVLASGLLTGTMAFAQVPAQELNTKGQTKPPAEELAPNAMIQDKAWEARQWDKAQWDKMSEADRTAYKNEHKKRWGLLNKNQQDSYRKQNMGRTNYVQPDWNDTQNVGGFKAGTPK